MEVFTEKDAKWYCYKVAESAVTSIAAVSSFSPNNVKRIIISPDGVVVQFFTSMILCTKPFDTQKASSCFSSADYVPIISVLGGKHGQSRVCSHIQEIVYCIKGINNLTLRQEELDFRSILSSAENVPQADLFALINMRFSRLSYITMADMTVTDLMRSVRDNLNDDFYFIGEDKAIQGVRGTNVRSKRPWYDSTYLRPEYYDMDKYNGKLYTSLEKIKTRGRENDLDSAKKATVDEMLSGKASEAISMSYASIKAILMLSNAYDRADFVVYMCKGRGSFEDQRIKNILSRTCNTGSLSCKADIIPNELQKILSLVGVTVMSDANQSTKESVDSITAELTRIASTLYVEFCTMYFAVLQSSYSKCPITTKTRMSKASMKVTFPEMMQPEKTDIEQALSRVFENASFNTSLATMCSGLCVLLIDCGSSDPLYEARDVKYWENKLKIEV